MSKLLINFVTKTCKPTITKKVSEKVTGQTLRNAIKNGSKSILHVKMNECKSAKISKDGITTVFTDQLTGCNSVYIIIRGKDGKPFIIMTHVMPTPKSIATQCENLNRELIENKEIFDNTSTPYVFFNTSNRVCNNPIFDTVRSVMNNHFKNGYEETVNQYTPLKSIFTANIFQFNPNNLNNITITNVGSEPYSKVINF